MLEEILWMWTVDPFHMLCTIPECEEQVAEDVEAEAGLDSIAVGFMGGGGQAG
jgi:hypothetical protein